MKKVLSVVLAAMMTILPTTAFADTNENISNVLSETLLSNQASTASSAKDPMNVYTSMTCSLSSNAGNGSVQNPYNRFEEAITQVADGGTIYISKQVSIFERAG